MGRTGVDVVEFTAPAVCAVQARRVAGELIEMAFPNLAPVVDEPPAALVAGLAAPVRAWLRNRQAWFAVLDDEAAVRAIRPDLAQLRTLAPLDLGDLALIGGFAERGVSVGLARIKGRHLAPRIELRSRRHLQPAHRLDRIVLFLQRVEIDLADHQRGFEVAEFPIGGLELGKRFLVAPARVHHHRPSRRATSASGENLCYVHLYRELHPSQECCPARSQLPCENRRRVVLYLFS